MRLLFGAPQDDPEQLPFRKWDQCGICGVVLDAHPDLYWDTAVEKFHDDKPKGYRNTWNQCRATAKAGKSAWLPKCVQSAVELGASFVQTFLFLCISLFAVYFEDLSCKDVKAFKNKLVTLYDFENQQVTGFLVQPTPKGRALGLPEVKMFRDSKIIMHEDLCPSLQIRKGREKIHSITSGKVGLKSATSK